MKILNLYAGLGGNRKLWEGHEITAVEYKADIAGFYSAHFPEDRIIVADAHDYLLRHYNEYDFIWSSAPCPTHSRANFWASKTADNRRKYYPSMSLYQEILFLKHWFTGKWIMENVVPYYEPLIKPDYTIGRHNIWCNFEVPDFDSVDADIHKGKQDDWIKTHGFDLTGYKIQWRKDQLYRNCVHPLTGLHILNAAIPPAAILKR